MRKLLFVLLTFLASPAFAADRYEFDKSHTNILFFIDHVGFSKMVGVFTDYDGYFTFDAQKPEDSTIDVTIKPSGIRTSSTALDEHLQKPEFFNTDKYPEIKFVSTGIQVTGAKTGIVNGSATLLGITKPVALKVTFNKGGYHPITQNYIAGFSAEATLKRSDFGMTTGIPMVGDEVKIMIETEGTNVDLKKKIEEKH